MPLSKNWTLLSVAAQAIRDLGLSQGCLAYQERVSIVNRAVQLFQSSYLGDIGHAYFQPLVITPATTGKTDTASITAGVLTVTTITLASTDAGSQFAIVISGTVYGGVILTVTSTTTATVLMLTAPPTSSGTIYVFPVQTASTASLSGQQIARLGNSHYGYLESTLVPQKAIKYLSYDHFLGFRPNSAMSENTVVYSIDGETMYLNKGKNLASYGTLTYHYARTPVPVVADTDYIDVPDGPAVEVVIMKVEEIFARRERLPVPDFRTDISLLLGTIKAELAGIARDAQRRAAAQMADAK
jgi:hypothetical protein